MNRDQAVEALATSAAGLTDLQRAEIRELEVSLGELGNILLAQEDPGCLPHFQEALTLAHRIGNRAAEASIAHSLGSAYLQVPGLRNPDQADHWFRHSLSLRPDSDRFGRARCHGQLGHLALRRFEDAQAAGESGPVLQRYLTAALHDYQQALDLDHPDDHENRAITENQLGAIYHKAGDTGQALRHYQRSIQHREAQGDIYGAGQTRYNIALLLDRAGRVGDALLYARAALDNFQQAGPGASDLVGHARQLIARLEQRSR